jgi:hypothetical protein
MATGAFKGGPPCRAQDRCGHGGELGEYRAGSMNPAAICSTYELRIDTLSV